MEKKKLNYKTFVKWYVIPLLAKKRFYFRYSRLQLKCFQLGKYFFAIFKLIFLDLVTWSSFLYIEQNSILFINCLFSTSESDRSDSYENAFKKNIDLINQFRIIFMVAKNQLVSLYLKVLRNLEKFPWFVNHLLVVSKLFPWKHSH
jgi:hypothetical protein